MQDLPHVEDVGEIEAFPAGQGVNGLFRIRSAGEGVTDRGSGGRVAALKRAPRS